MGKSSEAQRSIFSSICKFLLKPGIFAASILQALVFLFLLGSILQFKFAASNLTYLLLQSCSVAILVVILRWNWWWILIQFFLPFATFFVLANEFRLENSFYLFLIVFILHFGALHSRVPYFPSNLRLLPIIALLLPDKDQSKIMDLGCGNGRVLSNLQKVRPNLCLFGIELAILPFLWSKSMSYFGKLNAYIYFGNFFKLNLSEYDFVYCYLSSAVMPRLLQKVELEMRPDTVLVSCEFAAKEFSPDLTINYKNAPPLYVWRI